MTRILILKNNGVRRTAWENEMFRTAGVFAAFALAASAPVAAKTIVVQMKDAGAEGAMVFEPSFIKAMPGDVVRFVPTNPSHNAETMANMLPAGVTASKGGMGKQFDLTVTAPGIYGIKCMPHYSMGMVALVQVGAGPSANLAAAKAVKMPPIALKRMTAYLAKAK